MPVKDIDGVRTALQANELTELTGLAECTWLDVKEGVYQLEAPGGAEELVKDVAAFANAPSGGLLLVGFSTIKEHDQEIITALRPVPRDLVDTDRYRKLIRERIMPPPRGLNVTWIDCADGTGVLVIDVPAQPPARLPHVVPGPSRTTKVSKLSVAVPVREADGTHWLPQPELQRLLAAGWTATGGPSEEVLSSLIDKAVSAVRQGQGSPRLAFQVGQGDPSWARRFQEVATAVSANIPVGAPAGEVFSEGPGVAQHFDGADGGHGWVLSGLPRHKPVMVAEQVWEAVREMGSGAPGGWALDAIGFPVLAAEIAPSNRVVNSRANRVELAGGTWGPGFLIPDRSQDWRWEPARAFSMDLTRASRNWTARSQVPQLRLRAIASLLWAEPDLAITAAAHRSLWESLPHGKLAETAKALSVRRGTGLPLDDWQPGQTGQSRDRAGYVCTISAPDGRTVLSAEVMLALPNTLNSSVVTCAELRIEDFAIWRDALDLSATCGAGPAWPRLTVDDLYWVFVAAWQTATETLPAVLLADPAAAQPAGPPIIELRMSAEASQDAAPGQQPTLSDFVDLAAWGTSDRDHLAEMSVTITAPTHLETDDRQNLTRKAMVYMAEAFGFVNASGTW